MPLNIPIKKDYQLHRKISISMLNDLYNASHTASKGGRVENARQKEFYVKAKE